MLKAFQNTKLKASGSFQKNFNKNDKPTKPIVEIYERLIGSNGKKTIKSGRAFVVCCPLPRHGHDEKKPSCALYADTNSYFCFGCGGKGDYIKFVEEIENVDFKQALEIIKNL